MSVGLDITRRVAPPRSVFVNYPMGNETGFPGDAEARAVLVRRALREGAGIEAPGTIVDLGLGYDGRAPDGSRWEQWVYTKEFRRHLMKARDGAKPD